MAGRSLARWLVAAAFDAFGGWCFVDGEVLAVWVSGRLGVESERGPRSMGGARREKCQKSRCDPISCKRCDPISCKHALGCGGCVRAALADLESAYDMGAVA